MSALPQTQGNPIFVPEGSEKKVKDLMISLENFTTVSADSSLKDAIYILSNLKIGGDSIFSNNPYLLVFESKELIGILGIRQILVGAEPSSIKEGWYQGWNLPGAWSQPVFGEGFFTARCNELAEKPVREAMLPITFELKTSDSLSKAVFVLNKNGLDLIPVKEDDTIVGVLRSSDIFTELARIVG